MPRKRVLLRPLVRDRFTTALRRGASIRLAAGYADVAPSTVYNEMNRNPEFLEQVTRARARRRK